jgi:hypothetical protein
VAVTPSAFSSFADFARAYGDVYARDLPAPEEPYKIRFVIRLDNPLNPASKAKWVREAAPMFSLTESLNEAHLFNTASGAAKALSDRNKAVRTFRSARMTSRLYSIVPVRVVESPAVETKTPRVVEIPAFFHEGIPYATGYVRLRNGKLEFSSTPVFEPDPWMNVALLGATQEADGEWHFNFNMPYIRHGIQQILDLLDNPFVTASTPAVRTVTLA